MTRLNRDTSRDITDRYYTLSSTPSVGDKIYDENRDDSGLVVKSISGNTMDIGLNAKKLSIKYSTESVLNVNTWVINGTSYNVAFGDTLIVDISSGDSVNIFISGVYNYGILNSTDTSIIPNEYNSTNEGYSKTFVMPNKNLSFEIAFENHGPV